MSKANESRERGPDLNRVGPPHYKRAVKRMIAYQIERELLKQEISRAKLAEEMETSRAAVNRLLDPENESVTLQTLERAASILGKRLEIYFSE